MAVLGYLAAILMGISLGLIGGGGSILTVPILFYFFGQDSLQATANSLFVVGATALVGAILSARKGNIEFKTGIVFAVPSFFGVYFARKILLPVLPDELVSFGGLTLTKPLLIMIVFSILMVLASKAMIQARKLAPLKGKISYWNVGQKGFLVGATTGFVGAGGGFLIIPALVLLLRLSMRIAVGTSLAIIAANSLFGFAVSALDGSPREWSLLLTIVALGVGGIFLGHLGADKVNEVQLKKGFGIFVLVVGSVILIDQIRRMF